MKKKKKKLFDSAHNRHTDGARTNSANQSYKKDTCRIREISTTIYFSVST